MSRPIDRRQGVAAYRAAVRLRSLAAAFREGGTGYAGPAELREKMARYYDEQAADSYQKWQRYLAVADPEREARVRAARAAKWAKAPKALPLEGPKEKDDDE